MIASGKLSTELKCLELLQEAEYIAIASTDAAKIKADAILVYEEAREHQIRAKEAYVKSDAIKAPL